MKKFNIILIVLCLIIFCCFGVMFSKSETEKIKIVKELESKAINSQPVKNDTKISLDEWPKENTNISGNLELEGILNDSVENLVLITFDHGDIKIVSNDETKKKLGKHIGALISIKGNVEKKNSELEIIFESFQVIEDTNDEDVDELIENRTKSAEE